MAKASCDSCVYNVYDEDDETYYCEVDMDEDDAARLMQGHYRECPYYQLDDEYAVVRHQMKKGQGAAFKQRSLPFLSILFLATSDRSFHKALKERMRTVGSGL